MYNLPKNFINYCIPNPIYIANKTIKSSFQLFKYNISYPVLYPLSYNIFNTTVLDEINSSIYNDIISFKKGVQNQSYEYKQELKNNPDRPKIPFEVYVTYNLGFNKNYILSIPITLYKFTGGAHGMTYIVPYNYDLITGKKLNLKDIFKSGVNYEKIINNYIFDKISKDPQNYFSADDGFSDINDDEQFYIDNDGLVIYFPLYEIAPYSSGIPKFKLLFSEFGSYMNPRYVCNTCYY